MIELPRENGKRRYFCKSLHTTNYYEAQVSVTAVLRHRQSIPDVAPPPDSSPAPSHSTHAGLRTA